MSTSVSLGSGDSLEEDTGMSGSLSSDSEQADTSDLSQGNWSIDVGAGFEDSETGSSDSVNGKHVSLK